MSYIYTDIELLEDEDLGDAEGTGEITGEGTISGTGEAPAEWEWKYTDIIVLESESLEEESIAEGTGEIAGNGSIIGAGESTSYLYTSIVVLEDQDLQWSLGNIGGNGTIEAEGETPGAPAGKGWVFVAGLPWDPNHRSVLEGASPPAVNGDVIEWDLITTPGGFGITMNADGTFAFDDDDNTTQTFEYRLFRQETFTWYGPETVTVLSSDAYGTGTVSGTGSIEALGEGAPLTPNAIGNITGRGWIYGWGEAPIIPLAEGTGNIEGAGAISGSGTAMVGEGTGFISGNGSIEALGLIESSGLGNIAGRGRIVGRGIRTGARNRRMRIGL